jgi:hypothetical protein
MSELIHHEGTKATKKSNNNILFFLRALRALRAFVVNP